MIAPAMNGIHALRALAAQNNALRNDAKAALLKLLDYCKERNWAGPDPYDALNSEWLAELPLLNHRVPRLVLTQLLKRSPLDLRSLLRVPPTQNPKALGLFLSAFVKMRRMGLLADPSLIPEMITELEAARSPGTPYYCWGYSFPWQTRTHVVPRGSSNLVCTVFVANALLDAYEALREPRCLEMATSAARYIYEVLYWKDANGSTGFAYPLPSSRSGVINASLLGAALLCRVNRFSSEPEFLEAALAVTRYCTGKQRPDGAWTYGELKTQQWIDHFHTGYNLCALQSIGLDAATHEFDLNLQRGFDFYRAHFFRGDGAPRYFHNRTYPIDSHSVAQSLITLSKFKASDKRNAKLTRSVLAWAMENLWDPNGFFYYRAYPFWKIRTSYMRWTQAWMALALATFLETSNPLDD